ncbi:MAG TPA: glycyl-radical enzyme activating protein [Ruminiclostridium sp.]
MEKLASQQGIIFDVDHFAVHDGPGIRTTIYFKGCPLSCKWCHSPESQSDKPQILFASNRCIKCGACVGECTQCCQALSQDGKRKFMNEDCVCCGDCTKVCPSGAMFLSGKKLQIEDVMKEIIPDKVFFKNSGGGVTLTGGEVLMQAKFAYGLLRHLKEEGINTIVETSGYGNKEELLILAEFVDTFYYDFKLSDKKQFSYYTGGDLDIVLSNLRFLREKTDSIVLRIPLIPGITDSEENITTIYKIALELNITKLHLLPYNMAAGEKYEWCGKKYELEEMNSDASYNEHLKNMAPKELDVQIMN